MFTMSPTTMAVRSEEASSSTTASPVFTPTRTWRSASGVSAFSASTATGIWSAARTARSASSPRETGAPNTAITASPMNFSTVPPKRSISALTRA